VGSERKKKKKGKGGKREKEGKERERERKEKRRSLMSNASSLIAAVQIQIGLKLDNNICFQQVSGTDELTNIKQSYKGRKPPSSALLISLQRLNRRHIPIIAAALMVLMLAAYRGDIIAVEAGERYHSSIKTCRLNSAVSWWAPGPSGGCQVARKYAP
jgi:hypothetical protein